MKLTKDIMTLYFPHACSRDFSQVTGIFCAFIKNNNVSLRRNKETIYMMANN
ncbi:hypothetical protein FM106_04305 [Brachybacterium faecium]|nr:hypothetical protein FM106_04305 [Brachybacterium faecium]